MHYDVSYKGRSMHYVFCSGVWRLWELLDLDYDVGELWDLDYELESRR